jgi:hypothetical protein
MVIECNDKTNEAEAIQFLEGVGAKEISVQTRKPGGGLAIMLTIKGLFNK